METIKYDDDCGWYALIDGRVVCPAEGISGQMDDAIAALAFVMDANREPDGQQPGQWEYLP